MTRLSLALALALVSASAPALVGCSSCKKEPPPVPLDLTPASSATADTGPIQIEPLDDGGDTAPEAGAAKPHGKWTPPNPNAARIRQCCSAIRHEAQKLGAAPEAVMLVGIAAQCDVLAGQVTTGNAPEFGQVRTLLKGRTVPAACSGM